MGSSNRFQIDPLCSKVASRYIYGFMNQHFIHPLLIHSNNFKCQIIFPRPHASIGRDRVFKFGGNIERHRKVRPEVGVHVWSIGNDQSNSYIRHEIKALTEIFTERRHFPYADSQFPPKSKCQIRFDFVYACTRSGFNYLCKLPNNRDIGRESMNTVYRLAIDTRLGFWLKRLRDVFRRP